MPCTKEPAPENLLPILSTSQRKEIRDRIARMHGLDPDDTDIEVELLAVTFNHPE